MRRLDQDCAARIQTETFEAMSGEPAALTQDMGRHDEDDSSLGGLWGTIWETIWETMGETVSIRALAIRQAIPIRRRQSGQYGHQKTERGRQRRLRCRNDLMECAAGEAAIRQMRIECR